MENKLLSKLKNVLKTVIYISAVASIYEWKDKLLLAHKYSSNLGYKFNLFPKVTGNIHKSKLTVVTRKNYCIHQIQNCEFRLYNSWPEICL